MFAKVTNWPAAAFDRWLETELAGREQSHEPVLALPPGKRLSSALLDRIKLAPGRRLALKDPAVPGLEVRNGTQGRRWYVTAKVDKRQHKTSLLIPPGDDEIDRARAAAQAARTAIRSGRAPAAERRQAKIRARVETVVAKLEGTLCATVQELLDRHGEAKGDKQRTWPNRKATIERNLRRVPGLLELPPAELTPRHLRAVLQAGKDRGATVTARRSVTYLKAVYAHAHRERPDHPRGDGGRRARRGVVRPAQGCGPPVAAGRRRQPVRQLQGRTPRRRHGRRRAHPRPGSFR